MLIQQYLNIHSSELLNDAAENFNYGNRLVMVNILQQCKISKQPLKQTRKSIKTVVKYKSEHNERSNRKNHLKEPTVFYNHSEAYEELSQIAKVEKCEQKAATPQNSTHAWDTKKTRELHNRIDRKIKCA